MKWPAAKRKRKLETFKKGMIYVCVLALSLSGCNESNTQYSTGFSRDKWAQIKVGLPKAELIALLGQPLEIRTYIKFEDGSSNSYDGVLKEGVFEHIKELHYTWKYSKPRDEIGDYVVYEVMMDTADRVIGTNVYETD